ncbi:MAG: hypothetical protein JOZ95_25500 [Solirubrobacterales bacterium]|nr:hypothetical protein [Solirubrobacterales bacterium]
MLIEAVGHLQGDRAVGDELEPLLVGPRYLDLECRSDAGDRAADAFTTAGAQTPPGEAIHFKADGSPARDRRRPGQRAEDLVGIVS